uniref:Polycystin-related Y protein n=1 Tax=Drosophila mojavensis TaxID=7230 RepID=B7FF00_DROMO|nr:TPA_inf: polycystin-related Y protein [Drosophila mojavensis]
MRVNQFLVLISLANVTAFIRYDNPYVFVNRVYVNHTIFVIVTLQSLRGVWFLTKVSIEERIIDYFQTNASEHREQLLWYHTASLKQTLNFYGIFTQKNLPYQECFYHVSRANFFKSGFHNVSVLITTIGITSDKLRSSSYTYIDLDENVRCEPQFSIPQCVNADYPVHYEVSDIIVLRAMYTRRCPMDIFTQYYWTVHDSTERRPAFTIPPFTQQGEQSIRFILNIRSTFDLLRSSVAMQTILFSSYPRLYIDVIIKCVTNCKGNRFSNYSHVHLKAHCLSCKSMKITKWMWTVDHNLVSSSKRLLYYVSNKTSIIVYLNMEAIHRYKPSSKYQGSSTLRLERNYGPVHTACYVSPLDGEAIKTLFSIKCTNENALYKPLKYCLSVNSLLITECITDQLIISRLPAASHIEVQVFFNMFISLQVCDNLDVCIIKNIGVNVRQAFIADTEVAVFNFLNRVRYWLKYADWSMSFVMLDQIILRINSKERLLVFTEALAVYQPQTPVQLAHLVQILIKILDHIIPLDDMIVNVLARILHIIESTFKIVIANAEQNTLMDCYYKKMVEAMFEILDKFATEWEYIPKSQCRAESESCLNVDNFRNRLEQMSTLNPQVLEHINNWLHAHWKLNNCLFYMGMGMARRIHPDENAKKKDCRTFLMTMESFDLDLERALVIKSADAMHTLIFTEKLLQELRHLLRNDEVLISIRSHKHSQYWWYPEQDSRTQVLVVNAYTSTAILEKTQQLSEPFQYISKLTTKSCTYQYCKGRRRRRKSIEFDDPVEDVENVIHDNVVSSKEVRMYRTELYGHSVLGVTFTKADIDYRVLLHMTNNPQLNDIETKNTTCLVKSGSKPTALLLRNLCKEARPVYIYIRAENILRNWDSFRETGAYYTFSTEMRSCRIWKFARPEPSWQTILCIPEMNKSVSNGIHCRCNFISDLDADAKPIIAVRMNLKCHLERPVVGRNYEIIICYIVIPIVAIAFLLIQMHRAAFWDKPLYLEDVYSGELCRCGDIIIRISFGGRYHSGSSANIFLLLQSSRGKREIFVHQDPVKTAFNRNCTIFLRLDREFVQLPVRLALGHDNTGTHPHYFCRSIVITDILTEKTQHFRINRWVRTSPGAGSKMHLESTMVLDFATTSPKSIYRWPSRFAIAFELCMGKWYLFQSIIGPWRFGINRNSLSRWERSCIYVGKNFVAICIVIIFFGRAEPILCDPSPKRYNDFNIVVWLCLICLTASCITEILMIIFLRMLSKYN